MARLRSTSKACGLSSTRTPVYGFDVGAGAASGGPTRTSAIPTRDPRHQLHRMRAQAVSVCKPPDPADVPATPGPRACSGTPPRKQTNPGKRRVVRTLVRDHGGVASLPMRPRSTVGNLTRHGPMYWAVHPSGAADPPCLGPSTCRCSGALGAPQWIACDKRALLLNDRWPKPHGMYVAGRSA